LSFKVTAADAKLPAFELELAESPGAGAAMKVKETGAALDIAPSSAFLGTIGAAGWIGIPRRNFPANLNFFPGLNAGALAKPPAPKAVNHTLLKAKLKEATPRLEVRIFVDSIGGTLDVFLNGIPIARYQSGGADRIPHQVGSVSLSSLETGGAQNVVSDLRVAPWSGRLPDATGDRPALALTNGDTVPGSVTSVRDGKLLIDGEAGQMEIPMGRASVIDFGGGSTPGRSAARVHLRDGSTLQLEACHFDGSELTGTSAIFEEVRIPREALRELIPRPPAAGD
jgi:hypothetical protein